MVSSPPAPAPVVTPEQYRLNGSGADIVVIGMCIKDLTFYAPRFPREGETLHGTGFKPGWGGKGANQAVMAALMCTGPSGDDDDSDMVSDSGKPRKVAMIGKLGTDEIGIETRQNMKDRGVLEQFVWSTDEASSGVAGIMVNDNTGENAIIIAPGANDLLTEAEIQASSRLIANSKMLLCQMELKMRLNLAALKCAGPNTITILNTAPCPKDVNEVLKLMPYVNILVANEVELEMLVEGTIPNEMKEKYPYDLKTDGGVIRGCRMFYDQLARKMSNINLSGDKESMQENLYNGYRNKVDNIHDPSFQWILSDRAERLSFIVVTRGEKGCVIYDVKEQKSRIANEEEDVISDAVKKGIHWNIVPTTKIEQSKIVDTTGAGDCFVGSFAARELDNYETQIMQLSLAGVTASCEFACRAAGVSVQGKGTQSSYPATRREVFERS